MLSQKLTLYFVYCNIWYVQPEIQAQILYFSIIYDFCEIQNMSVIKFISKVLKGLK